MNTVTHKECRDCHTDKPATDFYRCWDGVGGLASYCKPCHNARGKKRRGTFGRIKESLPKDTKRCTKCKEVKPCGDFYIRGPAKLQPSCKKCVSATNVLSRQKNYDRVRDYNLKRNYGITLEEYKAMLVKQGNKCVTCGASFEEVQPDLDHCHVSGKARGVLCHNCNVAVGLLKDSPKLCRTLANYLERHVQLSPQVIEE